MAHGNKGKQRPDKMIEDSIRDKTISFRITTAKRQKIEELANGNIGEFMNKIVDYFLGSENG